MDYEKMWNKLKEVLQKNCQDGVVDDSWVLSFMYLLEKEFKNENLRNSY